MKMYFEEKLNELIILILRSKSSVLSRREMQDTSKKFIRKKLLTWGSQNEFSSQWEKNLLVSTINNLSGHPISTINGWQVCKYKHNDNLRKKCTDNWKEMLKCTNDRYYRYTIINTFNKSISILLINRFQYFR